MSRQTKRQPPTSEGEEEKLVEEHNHLVEFKTLKDLFSFVITKSIPGQQFLSVIRFKEYTYTFTPMDDSVMLFFTKEEPKAPIYAWDPDRDEFVTLQKPDRTRVNLLVQEVLQDTLIERLFYSKK